MSGAVMDIPIDQLRRLPLDKRIELVEVLLDSIESEAGPFPIAEEFADELDRRYQAHVADPASSIPWETVRAEMRRLLG